MTEELERLVALHKAGVLTEDEFKAQKGKILNPQPVAVGLPARKLRSKKWWVILAVAGIGAYFYIDSEYPEVFMRGLPSCDSRAARKLVERTVEENSVGLAQGRRIIQWLSNDSRGRPTAKMVRCHARVTLNVGGETGMAYTFEEKDDQTLISVEFD